MSINQKESPSEKQEDSGPDPGEGQDGGTFAWFQCTGAFCLFFNSWGLVNAFGAFQTYYEHGGIPNASPSQISWIGALQAFLFVFGGAVTGPLYDAGLLRTLVRFGSLTIVFGMMMTSLASQYWQFVLAQGLVIGIGNGCLFVPSISLLPQYFVKRRALSIGMAIIGGNFGGSGVLGGVIYAIMFHRLQPSIGFAWSVRVIAFMMLGMLVLPMTMLRMRMQPAAKRRLFDASAWKSWQFTLFGVACFIGLTGLYIPYFYVVTYAQQEAGISSNLSFYLVTIMNAGSIAGRIVLSYLADTTGSTRMMVICTGACAAISFGWIGCRSQGATIAFSVLYGFFSGTIISLVPAVVSISLCPDIRYIGLRIGMMMIPCSLGFLIGTPIGGALEAHGWLGVQLLTAFTLACSSACLAFLAVRQRG